MGLIDQQDIIVAVAPNGGAPAARDILHAEIETYPPVKIVSLSATDSLRGYTIVAVVETV